MTADRPERRASMMPQRTLDLCAAAALAGLVFLVRWLILDFDNDYFMHVAWAAEMLRGASPVRDFVEPGFILQTTLSYLSFVIGGYQLMGEGLLVCAFLAGATAATYLSCRALGIPRWLSFGVALIAAATSPRLYAYPKVFAYPVAVLAVLAYARSRSRSLLGLAVVTGMAFLFRHDHGVYIGAYVMLSLIALHVVTSNTASLRPALVRYGALSLLIVSPWVLWVLLSGHAGQYWDFLAGRSDGVANTYLTPLRFSIDRSNAALAFTPTTFPEAGVRWAAGTPPATRQELETVFGLEPLEQSDEGQTARYRLTRTDTTTLQAIVLSPAVQDTQGINRGTFRAPEAAFPWLYLKLQQYVPIVRLRVLPGYIRSANAVPWLNWVFLTLPLLALVMALGFMVWSKDEAGRVRSALVIAIAVLALVSYQKLVRASPDSRLGDVASLHLLLLAWVSSQAWRVSGRAAVLLKPTVFAVLMLTLSAAVSYGGIAGRLADAGVDGPVNLLRRIDDVAARYNQPPIDTYAPLDVSGLPQLARWLNACTPEADRIAVIGFEPQIYVVSERGFAGGLAFYDVAWHNSDRDQRLVIQRWSAQSVPVVLVMDAEWNAFSRDYPLIRAWLDEHYAPWGSTEIGTRKSVAIWLRRSDENIAQSDALPCLHPQEPNVQTVTRRRRLRLWN